MLNNNKEIIIGTLLGDSSLQTFMPDGIKLEDLGLFKKIKII